MRGLSNILRRELSLAHHMTQLIPASFYDWHPPDLFPGMPWRNCLLSFFLLLSIPNLCFPHIPISFSSTVLLGLPFTLCVWLYVISCTRNSAPICFSPFPDSAVPHPRKAMSLSLSPHCYLSAQQSSGLVQASFGGDSQGISQHSPLPSTWDAPVQSVAWGKSEFVRVSATQGLRRKAEVEALLSRKVQAGAISQLSELWTTSEMLGSEAMLHSWPIPLLWLSHSPFFPPQSTGFWPVIPSLTFWIWLENNRMTCRQESTETLSSQACGFTSSDNKSNISSFPPLMGLKNSPFRAIERNVRSTKTHQEKHL